MYPGTLLAGPMSGTAILRPKALDFQRLTGSLLGSGKVTRWLSGVDWAMAEADHWAWLLVSGSRQAMTRLEPPM